MRQLFKPSTILAMLALVIAASGTAFAATKLVSGDKLIKKGTLSGNRLRKHTITGTQINLNKLGKVPSAQKADTATSATSATTATNAHQRDQRDQCQQRRRARRSAREQLPEQLEPDRHQRNRDAGGDRHAEPP